MNVKISWQLLVLIAIMLAAVLASEIVGGGENKTIVLIVTAVLSGTLGPTVAARATAEKIDQVQQSADQAVAQTNGVMDQRIRDGVTSVLAEHGLIPTDDDDPADNAASEHAAG